MRLRWVGCRAIAARISPSFGGHLAAHNRVVNFFHGASGELFRQRDMGGIIFFATTRQPLVSLSSRWTMPGTGNAADAAQLSAQ